MAAAARRYASSHLTALSHGLTKQLSATDDAPNLVFSPLSIHSALSLVAAGARGRTLDEFLAVLGATSPDELAENVRGVVDLALPVGAQPLGGPRIAFACGVWLDAARPLKPRYRDAAKAHFRAVAHAVDFRTKVCPRSCY
jgi:serpin B